MWSNAKLCTSMQKFSKQMQKHLNKNFPTISNLPLGAPYVPFIQCGLLKLSVVCHPSSLRWCFSCQERLVYTFCLSISSQMSRGNSMTESPSVPVTTGQPSYLSDPSLSSRGGAGCRGGGEGGRAGSGGLGGASAFGGRSYPSFTDTLLQSAAASCSSSLRSAQTAHNALGPLISEGTTSTSYKSLANQTRNGSLSYESLLTPSESPEFESAAHELSPPRPHPPNSLSTVPGPPPVLGYTSPFLSAQQREGSLQACPAPLRPSPNRAFLRPTSSPPSRAPPLSPRARSLGSPPPGPAPGHTPLGKSLSYGGGAELQHRPSTSGGGTPMPKWVMPADFSRLSLSPPPQKNLHACVCDGQVEHWSPVFVIVFIWFGLSSSLCSVTLSLSSCNPWPLYCPSNFCTHPPSFSVLFPSLFSFFTFVCSLLPSLLLPCGHKDDYVSVLRFVLFC